MKTAEIQFKLMSDLIMFIYSYWLTLLYQAMLLYLKKTKKTNYDSKLKYMHLLEFRYHNAYKNDNPV